ncbi:hypothetical protein T440DRAFT_310064 [Plenodomus tracheiphilus IPT5]|uniref:RanBD1 domain-containing protein n=1 Tax=Plenodomus tracheiphilus IPT5 TaxID=1408161 RepID=A0A6A7BDR8_9PLEO|nr:hypothetical protein T440DRAFT_310064 [Plenodomus tracheiphilus IPT5]
MSAKRANVFSQGRPENPYEDRDGPPDPPQRATAAQMAARKIRNVKPRRPGASSGMSQSANFGSAPQAGGFGSPAPSENGANSFGFGAGSNGVNDAFGGGATSSFPPAQSSAPSNNFSNSSFPAFGANTQGTGFNPQPPSSNGFNFTAGGINNNPFGASAPAPTANGNTPTPTFGGGSSLFSPQPPSNSFGGLAQNNTSSAPSGNMFGATSGAPQNNMFGSISATPDVASTPTPASKPFTFGSATPSAPSNATPATSSMFSAFGASTQTAPPATTAIFSGFGTPTQTAPPTQNNNFNFGSNTPNNNASSQPAQSNMFGSISTNAQESTGVAKTAPASSQFNFTSAAPTSSAPAPTPFSASTTATPSSNTFAPAPAPGLFSFNPTAPKNDAPAPTLFGTSSAATAGNSTPAPAPASNPFANLAPPKNSTNSKSSLFTPSFTPQTNEKASTTSNSLFSGLKPMEPASATSVETQAQEKAPTTSSSLFSGSKPAGPDSATSTETPKANPFASLTKPASTPVAPPAATSPGFTIFGAAQKDNSSGDFKKPSDNTKVPGAPHSGLFNAFSTPQPAKTANAEKPAFNTVQPKPGTGIFAQSYTPKSGANMLNPDAFKSTTPFGKPSTPAPKEAQATSNESNPFQQQSTPASERPNLFSARKEAPVASPAAAMSASAGVSKALELPKVPKVHVPKGWAQPGSVAAQGAHGVYQNIADLTAQLQALNDKYRHQLSNLPTTADWSAISLWHYQHASDIKKKIDNAKKQRAAANGVTGTESALSTKRKVNEDSYEDRDPLSSKRARGGDAPATPTPRPSASTSSLQPTATSTSNMFAKAINGTKSSSVTSAASGLFAPKAVEKAPSEPLKSAPAASGFTPSFSAFGSTGASSSASSGFRPNFGSAPTGGFKPASSSTSGGGNFMDQFKKVAKTYEELAAERKAKAMAADYDSDDETEEEWSAKYDKKEAERLAEERRQVAKNTPTFSVPASTTSSGSTTPTATNPFASLNKPAGTTSAPNPFTSRAGSPALSTGSQSVLDAPSNAPTPNLFGHLSSAASSNNQDEDSEDEDEHASGEPSADLPAGSVESTTPPKRKFGDSEAEEESLEAMRRKKQEFGSSSKGSLLSRMTRADPKDAEIEKGNSSTSVFGQSDGAQTPTNKPFSFFDFGAASSKSSSTKPDSFAGDQTFKPGTPIKFGDAAATDKKASAPIFQFQPATPAPGDFSTTPAKPPPSSLFNFAPSTSGPSLLAPNAGLSSASSMPSSVFSSRAGTPLSEADTNASADDDEEGGKQEQVDFSQLTEAETHANEIIFHTEVVLAKHQIDDGKQKAWANLAKGPMWILKDKTTAKCFVRIRLPNGSTPLNYSILPSLRATVTGGSKKMVIASKPAKEGGLQSVLYAVKTPEIAEDLATKYNESLPSN